MQVRFVRVWCGVVWCGEVYLVCVSYFYCHPNAIIAMLYYYCPCSLYWVGPGVVFSWLIAGVGCLFSAMSYVEFATVLTDAGSSYAYVYYALGELPAVVAAWYLCLEYGIR